MTLNTLQCMEQPMEGEAIGLQMTGSEPKEPWLFVIIIAITAIFQILKFPFMEYKSGLVRLLRWNTMQHWICEE